jgi:hypothetical protein
MPETCAASASSHTRGLDHKCTHGFYSGYGGYPHGVLRYGPNTNTSIAFGSPRRALWSLTMLAVLAIGSFALALLTAGAVVPASIRPINADARLLKVSSGVEQHDTVNKDFLVWLP